jgi:hypothetical protein
MIRFTQVTRYSQILAIVLGVGIFALGFWIGLQKERESDTVNSTTGNTEKSDAYEYTYDMPNLALPLKYFKDSDIQWGSVGSGPLEDKTTWKSAAVNGGYQSFPTTTITIDESTYLNEKVSLAERDLSEYSVTRTDEFDVDRDEVEEKIISLCDGGNHCPHKVIIVKNDTIIFSTTAGAIGPTVTDTGTGNGFFLEWAPWTSNGDKWDVGLCCMPGYMKTRFVYENGVFSPKYEQEVLYFRVEETN